MNAVSQVAEAWYAATPRLRDTGAWLMDRSWYDRIRVECVDEQAELDRATRHRNALIRQDAPQPMRCPVCPAGPFALAELLDHIARKADPRNREPDPWDVLMGLPVRVSDDAGFPQLTERTCAAPA